MRKIYLYCKHGFGNRYHTLLNGLYLSRVFGLQPVVIWEINSYCMAPLDLLLDVDDVELMVPDSFHELYEKQQLYTVHVTGLDDMNQVAEVMNKSQLDLFICSWIPAKSFDLGIIGSVMDQIRIKPRFYAKAQQFLQSKGIDSFFGIHLRRTDVPENSEEDLHIRNLIQNSPNKHFFVCSDRQEVEAELCQYSNVFHYPKNQYDEKIDASQSWLIEKEKVRAFNVKRSAESVEEALVDLLILSESLIVKNNNGSLTSNSTFLYLALLLKAKVHNRLKFGQTYYEVFNYELYDKQPSKPGVSLDEL